MRFEAWMLGIAMIGTVFAGCVGDTGTPDPVDASGDSVAADPCEDPANATLVGTDGPDELDGTDDDDVIFGLGGDDVIRGHSGDDVICGGPGDDQIGGGPGNDVIDGGDGQDVCKEGPGSDTVVNCEAE